MSVLLRQPHGFEGLLPLLVDTEALDAPSRIVHTQAARAWHLDPVAPLAWSGDGHHHVIAGFDEFVWLDAERTPRPRRTRRKYRRI